MTWVIYELPVYVGIVVEKFVALRWQTRKMQDHAFTWDPTAFINLLYLAPLELRLADLTS